MSSELLPTPGTTHSHRRIKFPPIDELARMIREGETTLEDLAAAYGCGKTALYHRLNSGGYTGTGIPDVGVQIASRDVLFERPDLTWQSAAACQNEDPALFLWEGEGMKKAESLAKAVCAECPVRAQCLAFAIAAEAGDTDDHRFGIYGGLTHQERSALPETSGHGTFKGSLAHRRAGEDLCPPCARVDGLIRSHRDVSQ